MGLCSTDSSLWTSTQLVPISCLLIMTLMSSQRGAIQVWRIVLVHSDCHFSFSTRLDLFADGDDFSWQTIQRGRNQYYQRQLANQIEITTSRTLSLLTNAVKVHLNVGQNMTINTSSIFMSLETLTMPALSRKTVHQSESARIQLPPTIGLGLRDHSSISLRVRFFPVFVFRL